MEKHFYAEVEDPDLKLTIEKEDDIRAIVEVCETLGNRTRMAVLETLQRPPYQKSVPELVKELGIPKTTLLFHLNKLEAAHLVYIFYKTGEHGSVRYVSRNLKSVSITVYCNRPNKTPAVKSVMLSAGVGQFADFEGDSFSLATASKHYQLLTGRCFIPQRFEAQLVYTKKGRITYYFNNDTAKTQTVVELSLSLEICSEAPYYDNRYKSDITFWINNREVATFTCDGDYGDRRGHLTPAWWSDVNTQYGKLLTLSVTDDGVTINGKRVETKVRLKDLALQKGNKLVLTLGNKDTAEFPGGFNLFGKCFGDYPQDICLQFKYLA